MSEASNNNNIPRELIDFIKTRPFLPEDIGVLVGKLVEQAALAARMELAAEAKVEAAQQVTRKAQDQQLIEGAQSRIRDLIEEKIKGLDIDGIIQREIDKVVAEVRQRATAAIAEITPRTVPTPSIDRKPRATSDDATPIEIPDEYKDKVTPLVQALIEDAYFTTRLVYPNRDLGDWELSVRTANCLRNDNKLFLLDVLPLSEQELIKIPNFGRKSLNEIKDILSYCGGLTLGTPVENFALPLPALGENLRTALVAAREIRDALGIQPGQAVRIIDGNEIEAQQTQAFRRIGETVSQRQAVTNPHPMATVAAERRAKIRDIRTVAAQRTAAAVAASNLG